MPVPFDVENFVVYGLTKAENGELLEIEVFWRKHYQLFKEHGYTLQPRYQPNWIPSWWNTSKKWSKCEDGTANLGKLLDATRDEDGSIVMIKRIDPRKFAEEIHCGNLLRSERLKSPRNRCLRYLDVIEPPDSPDVAFLVMPYLIPTERVPFETIGEVVEFFRQIFEGLEFMHENNIAHGDCKYNNIIADSVHLFNAPNASILFAPNARFPEYPPGVPRLQPVPWGGDKSVPEHLLKDAPPCDPFPVDVYCLGNCIRQRFVYGWKFHQPKKGFEFIRDLVDDMTDPDPSKRPTMKEASSRLNVIIEGLDENKLRSPFLKAHEWMTLRQFIVHWTKQYIRKARGIPAIPRA